MSRPIFTVIWTRKFKGSKILAIHGLWLWALLNVLFMWDLLWSNGDLSVPSGWIGSPPRAIYERCYQNREKVEHWVEIGDYILPPLILLLLLFVELILVNILGQIEHNFFIWPFTASFWIVLVLFKQTLHFLKQICVKKVHSVCGTGNQTHDYKDMSLFPIPLDQGFSPTHNFCNEPLPASFGFYFRSFQTKLLAKKTLR